MAKASWFSISAASGVPTIYIYDVIGAYGVSARDFAAELKALGNLKGKALNVRINSPGGDVFQGNAIMVLLRDTGATITVYIDGIAASMASAIAMIGDKVIMAEGAQMMIHNPAGGMAGDSEELRSLATLLDSVKEGMVTAYSTKSGLSREAVAKIMDDETWFGAEEAVAAGFADEVGAVMKVAAFDLHKFRNPPSAEKESEMTKEEIAALVAEGIRGAVPGIVTAVTDALKPAPVAKADAEPVAKTPEALKAEVKAEMKAYSDEVTSLCDLAGLPEAAAAYITAEKPLAEVRADLKTKKAAAPRARTGSPINNHVAIGGEDAKDEDVSDLVPKAESSATIWARFNGKNKRAA